MDEQTRQAHRTSFGPAAALYDRIRPRYPADAISWATARPTGADTPRLTPRRAVDLGAGTGILSRDLLAAGLAVTAVEPDASMLAQLVRGSPDVVPVHGAAEDIPLPDGSADVVVAGQAYHWFDPARAHPEIARITRSGGVFALLWNVRDETEPWVAAMTAVVTSDNRDDGSGYATWRAVDLQPWFGPFEVREFRHTVPHTPDSLIDLVRSRSYYLTAGRRRQQAIEQSIRDLIANHPDLANRCQFAMPYVTRAYRTERLP